tara:strand:- start:347 stop:646 length:300 start_codon:yes stop_codon:yes gene_type:complete
MKNKSILSISGEKLTPDCQNVINVLFKSGIDYNIVKNNKLKNTCMIEFDKLGKNVLKNKIWSPINNNLNIYYCNLTIPNTFKGSIETYLESTLRPIYYK